MRAASVFYRGMFNYKQLSVPRDAIKKSDLNQDHDLYAELSSFMSTGDLLSNEVHVNDQSYKNGDLLVLNMEDCDVVKVGLVVAILIKSEKVFFVCKSYHCERNWLQYFESKWENQGCSFVESRSVADFKPLIRRGTSEKFVFTMHHRVSFMYK